MEFCDDCDNLMNPEIISDPKNKNKKLIKYRCTYCDLTKTSHDKKPIYKNEYDSDVFSENYVNAHTRFDATLPIITTIECPNSKCPSHELGENKVVGVRYNESDLKYIYMCKHCSKVWKN